MDFFMNMFYLFKQKTAYEMRISDWSSDVCSSDLFCICGTGMHTVEPARQSWIRQIQASARTAEFQRKTHHDIGGCKAVAREIGTLIQFGFQQVQMILQHCHHRLPRRSPQQAPLVSDQQSKKKRH